MNQYDRSRTGGLLYLKNNSFVTKIQSLNQQVVAYNLPPSQLKPITKFT